MVIISSILTPKGYKGMTVWPFIFLRSEELKEDKILINHERIHLKQQAELLLIFFYIWYAIEALRKGYENIRFEREAKENSWDLEYLKTRKPYNFLNYRK